MVPRQNGDFLPEWSLPERLTSRVVSSDSLPLLNSQLEPGVLPCARSRKILCSSCGSSQVWYAARKLEGLNPRSDRKPNLLRPVRWPRSRATTPGGLLASMFRHKARESAIECRGKLCC